MKIGVFSASAPAFQQCPNRAMNAIKFLQNKGHEVILGELFYNKDFYRSGSIKDRASEFNNLLKLKCNIYISSIGGFCSNSIVGLIDFKLIKKNMIFAGNSDASPILNAISQKTKARVIYGPSLISHFGEWEKIYSDKTYAKLMESITSKVNVIEEFDYWTDDYINWDKFEKPKRKHKNKTEFEGKVIVKGKLIGGNLNSLATTDLFLKTKFFKNKILFIEDSHKNLEQIEKLFSFLFISGALKKIKAIIFGKYEKYEDFGSKIKPHILIKEIYKANQIKIPNLVYYIDCGHTHPTNSLLLRKKMKIDFNNKEITQYIKMRGVI
ncbi:hypothetical protein SSABA_v1c03910 [Spiroplasma sabaudiense Ar-1343]|uniref:LD-carboxypeptidase n=1 Tax=Spiroplasma sabaudiense Ar-1343 TaxID=1276257 RepID=W6AAD4_9MOLU|nr:LD-carboxypeptidase [Spiroplasma sabaudiense]AHI53800.1 hypothetical protein SSABA_v1c03910 [Spiroplasma sabaudiense Ar-1343]